MDNFGQRLKAIRQSQSLTIVELARMTGLHVATIGRFERRGTRPSLPTVKKIADKLNVEPALLLGNAI